MTFALPKNEWPGRVYEIEVRSCTPSPNNEVALTAQITRERQIQLVKPLFHPNYYSAGEIRTKTPQVLPLYAAGACENFPLGFKGTYYVDNHPVPLRDKAVLMPVPEYLKSL